MTGLQELLLLAVLVLVIMLLTRSSGRQTRQISPRILGRRLHIPAARRLAIVLSLFWPLGMAAWLKPWQADPLRFMIIGVGPVAAGWAAWWITKGLRR